VLAAWDDMATYLPQMSDEQLKVATAPLEELDHLVRFQQRLAAAPASSSRGVARTCTNSGVTRSEYPGGDQSPVLLPQTLIDLITNLGQPTGRLWSAMELAFVQSVGAFPPGVLNSFAYAPGLEGEKQMNDFKALFEYYSGHFPQISLMETAPGIPGRLITISHPFKVIFDNEGRKNSMVLANAQFMNDDFGECQLANVAEMVSNLATVMDVGEVNTKLDSVITKVDSRASATDLASFRTDLTARVDSRASALDLATFRTDTGTGIGNVRSDIATVRAGAAFAFQGLSTKVDTRASFIEAALAARANELQLKLNTAEGMLLLILDEVD
jgi:hypothetical protein